jgi:hypothetical protein
MAYQSVTAQEGGGGSGQVPSLLAERARSECARSMRAVEGNLGRPLRRTTKRVQGDTRTARPQKALVGRAQ